jgi:hypothetical protein
MRWVVRCKAGVCHDATWLASAFAIRILVATLAHFLPVPPYRLVKEMQEAERTARFPVGS